MAYEVPVEKLRSFCDVQCLTSLTTAQVEPQVGILGQERALRALRFGLGTQSEGFNIYVSGWPGTGRTTAVMAFLEEEAKKKPTPSDWCYVNNFRDPYRPKAIRLPAGRARQFQNDMKTLVEEIRKQIPLAFESEQYAQRQEAITSVLQQQRQQIFAKLNEVAQQTGFVIQLSPAGLALVPLKDGKPMSEDEFSALAEEQRAQIVAKRASMESDVAAAMKQVRLAEKKAKQQLRDLDHEIALFAIRPPIQELEEKYEACPDVISYLAEVRQDVLEKLTAFQVEEEPKAIPPAFASQVQASVFRRYEVNVVVDNSALQGAPVITEMNLTYSNLFGRMEREAEFGALTTDFTMLKSGAVHRANGGYLVLQVEHLLASPFAWEGLKRALRSKQVVIEEISEIVGVVPIKSVRPEPIPLDAKMVLIGDPRAYHLLYGLDAEFRELFKVKAEFDVRMGRTPENVAAYMGFIGALCNREGLLHLQREAVAKIVEHGSRLAEDQEKLSTHFAEIADILREANVYATQEKASYIHAEHVQKAIDERIYRSDMLQHHIREAIEKGTLLIDTDGQAVGQVNGLSVLSLGDYEFGRPTRITATIGLGRDGVLDIEREAKLGGPVHTKGVLILGGYLTAKYAQDKPLALSARLVFEQSYEEVEGDSASSAELYAFLSVLSELPVKQGIAVTGSVDQLGKVQAIGGVNEKIEGFFDVCKAKGLTGSQGVIIPQSNVRHLMLKEEAVEAVRKGLFHVYAVESIDEGMEILTGITAGVRGADGAFADGTINARVDARLRKMAEDLQEFAKKEEE